MDAIGYIRVSTEQQATEGVSLAAQRERIQAYCVAAGMSLVGIREDAGISGYHAHNRPGLQQAMAEACDRKAALIVYSLSRFARNTREAIDLCDQLDNAGADLVSLTERIDTTTPAGKLIFRMMAALAEFERDQLSERVTDAMAFAKAQGRRVGSIPFGYDLGDDGVHLVENQGEQASITLIQQLHTEGLSLREVAGELNDRGISSKTGRAWSAKTVRDVIKRAAA